MINFCKNNYDLFCDKRSGAAAIEFSLLLPMMVVMYLGAVTAFEGYQARQAVARAAVSIVDLTTRELEMTTALRTNLFDVGEALIEDASESNPIILLASVSNPVSDVDPDARNLEWSYSNTQDFVPLTLSQISELDLPDIPKGNSVIVSYVQITHTPLSQLKILSDEPLFSGWLMNSVSFRRPRRTPMIETTIP